MLVLRLWHRTVVRGFRLRQFPGGHPGRPGLIGIRPTFRSLPKVALMENITQFPPDSQVTRRFLVRITSTSPAWLTHAYTHTHRWWWRTNVVGYYFRSPFVFRGEAEEEEKQKNWTRHSTATERIAQTFSFFQWHVSVASYQSRKKGTNTGKKLTCGLVEFSITSHTFSVQPITQGFHVVRNQSSMDCVGVVFGVKDRRIGKLILGRKGAIPCDEPYLVHSLPVKPLSCHCTATRIACFADFPTALIPQ